MGRGAEANVEAGIAGAGADSVALDPSVGSRSGLLASRARW